MIRELFKLHLNINNFFEFDKKNVFFPIDLFWLFVFGFTEHTSYITDTKMIFNKIQNEKYSNKFGINNFFFIQTYFFIVGYAW